MRLVHSLHDLRVLTRAQRKKLSASVTSENGNVTDTTAACMDVTTDPGSDHDPVHAPSSAPLVETIEDDDSSMDSPNVPDLRVHHPLSDSNSIDSNSTSHTPTHVSPSASQAFAPSLQRCTFEHITAHAGPLRHGQKKYLGSDFNLKVLWSAGVSAWEPLNTFFQDATQDVADCA